MADSTPSLHILGSRQFGGADQFYVRLIRAMHQAGQPVTAVNRPGSPVAKALIEEGIEQVHLPLANQWDLWSVWKIRQLVARRQPCVVQTYMGRATRLTRLPKSSSAVHIARLGGFYKIDGYYRHAHAWIGNTNAICDYLVREGIPAERVFHIGNFVPDASVVGGDEVAALRAQHAIPEDAWVLFALGRLILKKGFDFLLQALARLPQTLAGRPILLLIAGDGPELSSLRALSRELGQEARVRWLGWQNPPDAFYALADAFVCPSRHEPLGNVILEAWNYHVPVVSTRNDGARELIEEGRTGLLCDSEDTADLAGQLQSLLTASDADRRALGEAGHAYLSRHFSREAILDAYLSLYRQLLAGHAR